jgi:transposase
MSQRRKFTAAFKTKVVLEALNGRNTVQELAQKHQVHPNQISSWKSQFLESAKDVFSNGKGGDEMKELKMERERLLKIIGQQQLDIDFLKKSLS